MLVGDHAARGGPECGHAGTDSQVPSLHPPWLPSPPVGSGAQVGVPGQLRLVPGVEPVGGVPQAQVTEQVQAQMLPDGFIQQRAPDTGAQREAGGAVPQAEVAQHEGPHLRAQLLQAHYAPADGVSMFVALLAQVGHPDLGRGMPKSPAFLPPVSRGVAHQDLTAALSSNRFKSPAPGNTKHNQQVTQSGAVRPPIGQSNDRLLQRKNSAASCTQCLVRDAGLKIRGLRERRCAGGRRRPPC